MKRGDWQKTYWENFRSPLMDYSESMNDVYLKVNSQEEGTNSYNLFLELLVANHKF